MRSKKVSIDFFNVSIMLLAIGLWHYLHKSSPNLLLHGLFRRLYYIPIAYAAFRLGPIGVVSTALLSAFLYIVMLFPPQGQLGLSWILDNTLETIIYMVIGLTINIFVQLENRDRAILEKAHQELLKKEKMKSKFISIASHEFRTPLTVLSGYISLFEAGIFKGKDEEFRQKCAKAKEIINRYLQTIDNILEMVKTEQKEKIEKRDELQLNTIIREVYDDLEIFVQKRGQTLSLELEQSLPLILVNKREMNQVLTNLIMNAIKFTPDEGLITVRSKAVFDMIQIEVSDTGIGIPPEEWENIFESFYEVKPDDKHSSGTFEFQSGSLGLGLALVKRLVEHYQGKVWVESVVGKGSTFFVLLPLKGEENNVTPA